MTTITPKTHYRATLGASVVTLRTVPALTTAIISSIIVDNSDTVTRTFTLTLDGIPFLTAVPVDPGYPFVLDCHQELAAGKIIAGGASVASKVSAHIGGIEAS